MFRISPKLFWVLFASFLLFFGGSINPLVYEEQLQRRINPSSLLEPNSPEISDFNAMFEKALQFDKQRTKIVNTIENQRIHEIQLLETFMLLQIKYIPDIVQNLAIDHLATSIESLNTRMDDCDGRAALATSLLIHRGYNAWVVVSWTHWWTEVLFKDGSSIQLLIREYQASWSWYMKFNDTETMFRGSRVMGYILYNFLLAALIPFFLPRLYNILPRNVNFRLLLRFMFLLWVIPLCFILVMFHVLVV